MKPSQKRLRMGVLDLLGSDGPQSRADLARKLGVSRSTMSLLTTSLLSEGILREIDSEDDASRIAGRPGTRLALCEPEGYYIGIDFGRIFIKAAISDGNYRIIEQISGDFDIDMPAEAALDLAADKVEQIVAASGVDRSQIRAVGMRMQRGGVGATRRRHLRLREHRAVEPAPVPGQRIENLPWRPGLALKMHHRKETAIGECM